MEEKEYLLVTNKTNLSIAIELLRSISLDDTKDKEVLVGATISLCELLAKMFAQVELQDERD